MRRYLLIFILMLTLVGCDTLIEQEPVSEVQSMLSEAEPLEVATVVKKPIPPGLGVMMGEAREGMTHRVFVYQNQVEASTGQYNWTPIYNQLKADELAGALGTVIQFLPYSSDSRSSTGLYKTWFPDDYPSPITLSSGGYTAVMPAYSNATYQARIIQTVKAMGAEFDDDPRVIGVIISTGIDGESQPIKNGTIAWQTIMDEQAAGQASAFNKWCKTLIPIYAEAFPTTQVWFDGAPGGNQRDIRYAVCVTNGVGWKHSGGRYDLDSAKGYGDQIGSWDPLDHRLVPNWIESAYGLGDDWTKYWGWYMVLNFDPVGCDVHSEWFEQVDTTFLAWVEAHIGRDLSETPSVWSVLRVMEYEKQTWTTSAGVQGVSGWPDCYGQGLTVDGWTSVPVGEMPGSNDWRSHQGGLIKAASVTIDPAFQRDAYALTIIVYGQADTSLVASWSTALGTVSAAVPIASTGWTTATLALPGLEIPTTGAAITLTGQAYVHRIEVEAQDKPTPTPSWTAKPTTMPSATPSPTVTASCTPTPTQKVPTSTCTATPSCICVCPPMPTLWPTYTPYPTYTLYPTAQPDATLTLYEEKLRLEARASTEYGTDVRIRFEFEP